MKKIFNLGLIFLLIFFLISFVLANGSSGITSTPISSCSDLAKMHEKTGFFYLTNDIDCSNIKINSINFGSSSSKTSVFDGRGYLIENVHMDNDVGLFYKVQNAVIKNLNLINFSVNKYSSRCGGNLASYVKYTVIQNINLDNFFITGNGDCAGGLIGSTDHSYLFDIKVNNGKIFGNLSKEIGGVAGRTTNSFFENVFSNDINISLDYVGASDVGGVAGNSTQGYFKNIVGGSKNYFGKMTCCIGGIFGVVSKSKLINIVNDADIKPIKVSNKVLENIGGVVGKGSEVVLINVQNFGDLFASGDSTRIGGVIGNATGKTILFNVINKGNVAGSKFITGIGYVHQYSKEKLFNFGVINSIEKNNYCSLLLTSSSYILYWYGADSGFCEFDKESTCLNAGYIRRFLVGYYLKNSGNGYFQFLYGSKGIRHYTDLPPQVCDYWDFKTGTPDHAIESDCIGPIVGDKSYDGNKHAVPKGELKLFSINENRLSDDNSSLLVCESWCNNKKLVYIGGILPYCMSNNVFNSYGGDVCIDGDGICPEGCTPENDSDCVEECAEVGENCGNGCCNGLNCVNGVCGFGDGKDPISGDCVAFGDTCVLNKDCCGWLNCVDGVCGFGDGTEPGDECVYEGDDCLIDDDCCEGLVCGENNICVKKIFTCLGEIDSNSEKCEGSDLDLTQDTPIIISNECSGEQCEWVCKEGFEKGSGLDENKCVLIEGFYKNCLEEEIGENWVIFPGDDEGLTVFDERVPVLVYKNTSRKCEYTCRKGYEIVDTRQGLRCVPLDANIGVCGEPNRKYYIGEEFPKNTEIFCERGEYFGRIPPILTDQPGDSFEWTCIHIDENAECRADRVKEMIIDVDSILDLRAVYDGSELVINILCSKKTLAKLQLFDEENNEIILKENSIQCETNLTQKKIKPNQSLVPNKSYSLNASIKEKAPNCFICSKTTFFRFTKQEETNIPDNSFTLVLLLLVGVIIVLLTPNKK